MMKRRFSIEKEEWTGKREGYYRKSCFNITFQFRDRLVVENQIVYILRGIEKITISEPIKEKSFWFETWTDLKKYYEQFNIR